MNRSLKRRRFRRFLPVERLEDRLCLAATVFPHQHDVTTGPPAGAVSAHAVDMDGDGDLDVLAAAYREDSVFWLENRDGQGMFGTRHAIATGLDGPWSTCAADLDGDGDLDVVVGTNTTVGSDRVAWYENTDGRGAFGAQQLISSVVRGVRSVYVADLDGDGKLDVLSASNLDDKVAWYRNSNGEGTFEKQQIITWDADDPWSVSAADVDGDGDLDVLSASYVDGTVAWYENSGQGVFGGTQVVADSVTGAISVRAADLNGDGDMDLMAASYGGDQISWWENTDGRGAFAEQPPVAYGVDGPLALEAADLDGDGDLDVLAAAYGGDRTAWFQNTDGRGSFGLEQPLAAIAGGAASVQAADLDGDGDLDVLSALYGAEYGNRVIWQQNTNGQGSFGPDWDVVPPVAGLRSVYAADLDGDGDTDLLSASRLDSKIAWYQNLDGRGAFRQRTIATDAGLANSVYAADLDGDGDLDVLAASSRDDTVAWYENTDGQGTFGTKRVITTDANGAKSVYAADLDGDGDTDVLSVSSSDDKVAWYENTDGRGTFGPQRVISTETNLLNAVYAADLDGDGDIDVLSASRNDNKVAWYENTDGRGAFGPQQIVTSEALGATSVSAADLDGDGDMDVVSASSIDNTIAWYKNTDGQGSFGAKQIVTDNVHSPQFVMAVDIDGDSDKDLVSASRLDDTVAWYENVNGQGTFGPPLLVAADADGARYLAFGDIDGDGDLDLVSASETNNVIAWHESRLIGDVNDDGVFDSSDLVQVFQAGKYEDAAAGSATFEEGDWDNDGDFDSSDIVLAFQAGAYEATAGRATSDRVAAIDMVFSEWNPRSRLRAYLA